MNYLSEEEKWALWHLACRVDKVRPHKTGNPWAGFDSNKWKSICFVCGAELAYTAEELTSHGRQHLKEHNLLVFT